MNVKAKKRKEQEEWKKAAKREIDGRQWFWRDIDDDFCPLFVLWHEVSSWQGVSDVYRKKYPYCYRFVVIETFSVKVGVKHLIPVDEIERMKKKKIYKRTKKTWNLILWQSSLSSNKKIRTIVLHFSWVKNHFSEKQKSATVSYVFILIIVIFR